MSNNLEEEVKHHRHLLVGNGNPGILGRLDAQEHLINGIRSDLNANTHAVDKLADELASIARERRDEEKRREGSLNTLKWVKWALSLLLTIVIFGGSLGMWRITNQWEQVQQQLQRIPALPE